MKRAILNVGVLCALGGDGSSRMTVKRPRWLKRLGALAVALPAAALVSGCSVEVDGEEVDEVEQASHSTPRELHVVGVTSAGGASGGGLHHALRTNTTWTWFGDVELQAGEIGTISDAEVAYSEGGLHLVAVSGGTLFHTIRDALGGWFGFGNVNALLGSVGTHVSVGLADGHNRTHLCTATSAGGLFYTRRNSDGSWENWLNVKTATGSNPGSFTRVDCAARTFGGSPLGVLLDEMHLVGTTSDGTMWHAVRTDNGFWTPLGNVNAVTGSTAVFTDADVSFTGDDLQVVGTGTNLQQHAIRFLNGSWTAFTSMGPYAGDPGDERHSSVVGLDDGLHVLAVTANGGMFNTLRQNSGAWVPYANVKTATGSTSTFRRVSVSGVSAHAEPH
jgi:hypothetical protein